MPSLVISSSLILYTHTMRKLFILVSLLVAVFASFTALCQTNPAPQSIPYSQNFSSLAHSSTTYPEGWQGWTIGTSTTLNFRTTAPTGDRGLTASGHAGLNSGNIYNYNEKIGFLTTGSLDLALVLALNTTGKNNISVNYDAVTIRNPYDGGSNNRINEMTLQYRVGTTGSFTSLTGIEYQNNTTLQTGTGVTTPQNLQSKTITLPSICNNQPLVQIRWVNRDFSGGGARPSFAVDNIVVTAEAVQNNTVSVAADVNASEPSTNGSFNITVSHPAPAGGVTVAYTLSGTATAGVHYSDPGNGSITIAEGSTTGTVVINVVDDNDYHETKTIVINLTSATAGYVLGSTSSATINRLDKDPRPLPVLPYTQTFTIPHSSTEYPYNWNGWVVGTAPGTSYNTASTTTVRGLAASGAAGSSSGNVYNYDGKIGFLNTGGLDLALGFTFNAGGKVNIQISYDIMTIRNPYDGSNNSRINEVTLQYRIGTSGSFTTLTGIEYQNNTTTQTSGTTPQNLQARRITLPSACNNQPVIEIRWISRQVIGGGSRPSFAVDNITVDENTEPPVIVNRYPASGATNIPVNFTASLTFNVSVQKGQGNIYVKNAGDHSIIHTIDVADPAVTVAGQNMSVNVSGLPEHTAVYIEMDQGALKDLFNADFEGISGATAWTVTIGNLFYLATFQNCSSVLSDGFTQYSVTGAQVWACTTFGRDASGSTTASAPNGVQMNGFASGTNVPNEDWFISPAYNLTGTTYPLLSFWSRTAFNGAPLQLKVSSDYPGTGDPSLYTWADLNGKFPGQTSNVWTLSENINLSAYKATRVYVAFVYTSSIDDGARWTLDDISITNSSTPPPQTLTVSTTDVQFTYVGSGSTGNKTFNFIGNDLTGDVTLTATGPFTLSKDGNSFSSSITYTKEEADDLYKTVHVQFAPTAPNENYTGTISVNTSGLSAVINAKGSSIDPATTLEVVNWNIEWFGHTGNGPVNEELQEANVLKILKAVDADVYGLMEIVDEAKLKKVVDQLDGYDYVISDFGSHTNTSKNPPSALAGAQKLAFVYKTSVVTNLGARPMLSQGLNTAEDAAHPYYYYWSSGRFPYMMDADVTLGGVTKNMKFILVHAKANTSPVNVSYDRRKAGADVLYDSLKILFPSDPLVIFGDFNDDLDVSITAGYTITSWNIFTNDEIEYAPLTLPLSLAGKKSTVAYNDIIDHVVVSNEMNTWYLNSTASILTDVAGTVSNYGSTTSDHYPVFTRFMYCTLAKPADMVITNKPGACGAEVSYTYSFSQTCGTVTSTHASGSFFTIGSTIVTLSATTGETVTFTVTVNDTEVPVITHSGDMTVNNNAGKCGAAVSASATASDNCAESLSPTGVRDDGKGLSDDYPVGTTHITWTVSDANNNQATVIQSITVTDNEAPVLTCPQVPIQCFNNSGTYTIPTLLASDNCGVTSISYTITGATVRSGTGNNASGVFNIGSSTINWTATDASGNSKTCTNNVLVNSQINSNIAPAFAITPGGAVNTVYIGYAPASSIILSGTASGGTAPYVYKWMAGSSAGSTLANTATYTVAPTVSTTYFFKVSDANGCDAGVITSTINVVDVRCGPSMDRVSVCQVFKDRSVSNCVSESGVAALLANGATLGTCASSGNAKVMDNTVTSRSSELMLKASPNPSAGQFNIHITSEYAEPIILRVTDLLGRTLEVRNNVIPNTKIQLGAAYKAGVYMIEVKQGDKKKQMKMVKL